MKYTKYLINGNYIDIESMQTDNLIFKYPVQILSIVAAIVGVIAITGLLPVALIFDEYQNTKQFILIWRKKGYKIPVNDIPKWVLKRVIKVKTYWRVG